mmetsp:Transcript_6232/g.17380  ORF Transcript_6232/g.17380 Transcript_6232/m.17380 type:complete len:329 (+) Transcript_6232:440-1426(+)
MSLFHSTQYSAERTRSSGGLSASILGAWASTKVQLLPSDSWPRGRLRSPRPQKQRRVLDITLSGCRVSWTTGPNSLSPAGMDLMSRLRKIREAGRSNGYSPASAAYSQDTLTAPSCMSSCMALTPSDLRNLASDIVPLRPHPVSSGMGPSGCVTPGLAPALFALRCVPPALAPGLRARGGRPVLARGPVLVRGAAPARGPVPVRGPERCAPPPARAALPRLAPPEEAEAAAAAIVAARPVSGSHPGGSFKLSTRIALCRRTSSHSNRLVNPCQNDFRQAANSLCIASTLPGSAVRASSRSRSSLQDRSTTNGAPLSNNGLKAFRHAWF